MPQLFSLQPRRLAAQYSYGCGSALRRLALVPLLFFATHHSYSQSAPVPSGTIHGIVKSGNMPIPGAAISVSLDSSTEKITAWTDVDGGYSVVLPAYGSYTVSV